MCGIVGFVGPRDDETLIAMRESLRHRGPDGAGLFADEKVSLGHRRLSIVDVAGGAQPMFGADGRTCIVYNGEIYNQPQLKRELEAAGVKYRTRSDTETILHLYDKHGFDCVKKLEGMFAFVIYDRRKRLLFGARDPMGEKPLYYTPPDDGAVRLAFASESKALREHPALARRFALSQRGLIDYLLHDYTVGMRTIHDGVQRLQPGWAFTFELDELALSIPSGFLMWPYSGLDFRESDREPHRVLELLDAAVEKQLMSDVPLGVFLSGGIDSSSIVSLLSKNRPAAEIDTFSIGFDDPTFDETMYSTHVAAHFGTRHHHRRFTAKDLLERLPTLTAHLDEPFADPSILPVSLLSEFARERVTVALGGDGGDELFAGYDPFLALAPARRYRRFVPSFVHEWLVEPMSRLLPASDDNMSFAFRVQRFLRAFYLNPTYLRSAAWMGPFSWSGLQKLLPSLTDGLTSDDVYRSELDRHALREVGYITDLTDALDFFQGIYLPDDILVKVDRASMQHSLEVRCPFLDPRLVEYVNHLPDSFKLRGKRTKAGFKELLLSKNLLPAHIVNRKKKGFGIPVARWLKHELKSEFETRVLHDWPKDLPPLMKAEVEALWLPHLAGKRNNYKELWALLMLAWWARNR